MKEELNHDEIDQFKSISSSGRPYPLKIPHARLRILYRSIHNYSSIEENTFLKERVLLGTCNTSVFLYHCYYNPLIVIVVPM